MRRIMAVAGLAGLLVAGGIGYQIASAASPQLHACLDGGGAPLKIVKKASKCPAATARIRSWNVQGEPGPAGPAGPAGDRGPAGFSGFERVSREVSVTVDAYAQIRLDAPCPTGKTVIGGSSRTVYDYEGSQESPTQIALQNSFAASETAWRSVWVNQSEYFLGQVRFVTTANCAAGI